MIRFAELIQANGDLLALTETLDMGKPVKYAKGVDVNSAANCVRWYGEAVDKVYDEIAPTPDTALALITREPVGVVGVIVPWNYPMIMAAWKIAPALAAGNSVVLEAVRKEPADGAQAGRAGAGGRHSARRVQRRARLRP
jgi:acyl-CoA reductase-like NAD-dependent aldehyde dehydrogenase